MSPFRARIESRGDLLFRFDPSLACRCNSHLGPGAEIEGLLPTEVTVIHAPELRAVRLYEKVKPLGVGYLVGFVPGLSVGDLDVVQCHDGASSKGLAGTIKNTIILMVLPMDSGG